MPAHNRSHYQTHDYKRRSVAVRAKANADPTTRCWRCGQGARPADPWVSGHTVDSDSSYPLAAEHQSCNASAGASYGNRKRRPTSRFFAR